MKTKKGLGGKQAGVREENDSSGGGVSGSGILVVGVECSSSSSSATATAASECQNARMCWPLPGCRLGGTGLTVTLSASTADTLQVRVNTFLAGEVRRVGVQGLPQPSCRDPVISTAWLIFGTALYSGERVRCPTFGGYILSRVTAAHPVCLGSVCRRGLCGGVPGATRAAGHLHRHGRSGPRRQALAAEVANGALTF